MKKNSITIFSNKKKVVLNVSTILYVLMMGNNAEIHVSGGNIYETRMTLGELSEMLGEGFIKAHRGCMVSVMAIHDITDKINLSNGESLIYTLRKKKEIMEQFHEKQKSIILSFTEKNIPMTEEEYLEHYRCFDDMPFAFADTNYLIQMTSAWNTEIIDYYGAVGSNGGWNKTTEKFLFSFYYNASGAYNVRFDVYVTGRWK